MSKQRKVPKHHHHHFPGDGNRWVVKKPAAADDGAPRAVESQVLPTEPDLTLEEFKSQWQAPGDLESVSRTDYYFNSYAHFGIHEAMLKDAARTGAYKAAIMNNPELFAGKTVLDVGSGTGILCLFAAKAGAKRCIGIECSDIADYATIIAETNGFGDVITYVRGKVEEVELPVDKVDIIISEWMGYFLIYESMLDSVLVARDKWLIEGGLMFPDHARLHMAAIEDADYRDEKVGFWQHIWGFDFSPMQKCVIQEPISDTVEKRAIATSKVCILDIDLRTVTAAELDFYTTYTLKVKRKDFLHALVVWFDVSFKACSPEVVLTTAPGKSETHWKQTVLYIDDPIVAHEGDVISGAIAVRKNITNPRDLDVKLSIDVKGQLQRPSALQYYRLR